MLRSPPLLLLLLLATATACGTPHGDDETRVESELVGGRRDLRWASSGYLARGPSMADLDLSKPTCGATLIAPNVVVTAAHCVADDDATFAFGAGDTASGPLVRVVERHVHPSYRPEPQQPVDLVHALRKYDVAYLVLERDVDFAAPAELPDGPPRSGCTIQAIGYRPQPEGASALRVSTPACVMFRLTLGRDPIFEVHPQDDSALCIADGDEGSAVVDRDASRSVLVGIYVGSVTQRLTDCRRGTQYLNGYESMYGYREFLLDGIARARSR